MALSSDTSARRRPWLLLVGLLLMLVGVGAAAAVQTAGGVTVTDERWTAPDGTRLSALLYRPAGATAATPAPGILAVHGYINTRETQSAFAIEFARRGWVVLALDQRGHGYSRGAAVTKGFGGPEGLAHLRALPFVDKARIGLEGHSMGGWTVLAAAAAAPDAYTSMVLEGSTPGKPFARTGTPAWPRNLAVVFSRFDEFAPLMWGVPHAGDLPGAPKLRALFGSAERVEPGRMYGDLAAGTARVLHQPPVTHPGDHVSTRAVGHALDWFGRTLGGAPRPPGDQIWPWHEFATGLALVGLVPFLMGLADLLLATPPFAGLRAAPVAARERRDGGWWTLLTLGALIPAATYYVAVLGAPNPLAASRLFPQRITNWLIVWALANTLITLALGLLFRRRGLSAAAPWPLAAGLALSLAAAAYACLGLANLVHVDFRFWVVALKPLGTHQVTAFLSALIPFTLFTLASFRAVSGLTVRGEGAAAQYATAVAALAAGFLLLTGAQYLVLFATGALPFAFEALNAIVAIQFVPVLAAFAALHVFLLRRTGSYAPAALLCGVLVSWYVVAGTATHVA